MQCPKCSQKLFTWWWEDGGARGVTCSSCGQAWWSNAHADAIQRVTSEAVELYMKSAKFPDDARTKEYEARCVAERMERKASVEKWDICICAEFDGKGISTCGFLCPQHGKD